MIRRAGRRLHRTAVIGAIVLAVGGCIAAAPPPEATDDPAQPAATPPAESPTPLTSPRPEPLTEEVTDGPASPTATPESPPPVLSPRSPLPSSPPPTAAARETSQPTMSPGSGPRGEWQDAERVLAGGYSEPSLVVDAHGIAHIAAVRDGAIVYLTNASGEWSEEQLSTPPGTGLQRQADSQPSLALDGDGSLGVAFARFGAEDTFGRLPAGIHYVSNEAGDWSAPTLLVDDDAGAHSPSLQLRDGRVHLAYVLGAAVDIVSPDQRFPIRYGDAAEGQPWSDHEISINGTHPALALATDGRPYILFGDDHGLLGGDALRLAVGHADGGFEIEEIPGTSRYADPFDLALDGDRAMVAWTRPGWASSDDRWAAFWQVRDGTWSEPERLVLDGSVRAVAVGDGEVVHTVGGHLEGVWYGRAETGAFELQQLSQRVERWADVAVDGDGRPHVVYVAGEEGTNELWYTVGPAG